jgi:hypothetical protein
MRWLVSIVFALFVCFVFWGSFPHKHHFLAQHLVKHADFDTVWQNLAHNRSLFLAHPFVDRSIESSNASVSTLIDLPISIRAHDNGEVSSATTLSNIGLHAFVQWWLDVACSLAALLLRPSIQLRLIPIAPVRDSETYGITVLTVHYLFDDSASTLWGTPVQDFAPYLWSPVKGSITFRLWASHISGSIAATSVEQSIEVFQLSCLVHLQLMSVHSFFFNEFSWLGLGWQLQLTKIASRRLTHCS